jgi:hypothetical protein
VKPIAKRADVPTLMEQAPRPEPGNRTLGIPRVGMVSPELAARIASETSEASPVAAEVATDIAAATEDVK